MPADSESGSDSVDEGAASKRRNLGGIGFALPSTQLQVGDRVVIGEEGFGAVIVPASQPVAGPSNAKDSPPPSSQGSVSDLSQESLDAEKSGDGKQTNSQTSEIETPEEGEEDAEGENDVDMIESS